MKIGLDANAKLRVVAYMCLAEPTSLTFFRKIG